MSIDERTTQCLGDELVRLVKVLISMRQHAPAPHPHVDHTHFPVLFNLAANRGGCPTSPGACMRTSRR